MAVGLAEPGQDGRELNFTDFTREYLALRCSSQPRSSRRARRTDDHSN
jgi:hypothetical protein